MAINIKQITNYDLDDAESVTKTITVGGKVISYEYKIISPNMLGGKPIKLGYCCDIRKIQYPIFLTINNREEKFEIGKTGMLEYQPEVNQETELEMIVYVDEVKVPVDVRFTLDYCVEI